MQQFLARSARWPLIEKCCFRRSLKTIRHNTICLIFLSANHRRPLDVAEVPMRPAMLLPRRVCAEPAQVVLELRRARVTTEITMRV